LFVDQEPEALALHELEHEVGWLLLGVIAQKRGDVGVVDSGGHVGFLDQPWASVVAEDEFEGDDFADSFLLASPLSAPDLAEPSASEGLEELVALADHLPRDVGRCEGEGLFVEALDVAGSNAAARDGALKLLAEGVADEEPRVVGAGGALGNVGMCKSGDDDVPARGQLGSVFVEADARLGERSGQEFMEQDSKREEVGAWIELAALALLGGHVGQGPGYGRGSAHEGHREVDLFHEARRGSP